METSGSFSLPRTFSAAYSVLAIGTNVPMHKASFSSNSTVTIQLTLTPCTFYWLAVGFC